MGKKAMTEEGATGSSTRVHLETICSPSEDVVKTVEATKEECQQGTQPKEPVSWQTAQPGLSQWGETAAAVPPQELGAVVMPPKYRMGTCLMRTVQTPE